MREKSISTHLVVNLGLREKIKIDLHWHQFPRRRGERKSYQWQTASRGHGRHPSCVVSLLGTMQSPEVSRPAREILSKEQRALSIRTGPRQVARKLLIEFIGVGGGLKGDLNILPARETFHLSPDDTHHLSTCAEVPHNP